MNIYLINALLVLLVIRQIREHQLDLRALAVPVLAVAAAAVMFLHSVPGGGSDITLELLGVSAGAAMGAIGGLATRLRPGPGGPRPVWCPRAPALAPATAAAGPAARHRVEPCRSCSGAADRSRAGPGLSSSCVPPAGLPGLP